MMRRARLLALLWALVALFYALGLAVARYLGVFRRWDAALMGLFWVAVVVGGGEALGRAFDERAEAATRRRMLNQAFAFLAVAALETTFLAEPHLLSPTAMLLQSTLASIAVAWGAPPFRLALSGYGEVLLAAGLGLLVPALAFALQTGTWHRLLGMVGVPLFAMALAAALAWDFPNYAAHLREDRRTLLMRLDWRAALHFHNLAWLTGFLLLALDVALGLPWEIAAPCGIAFLSALMQVWMMRRIAQGARPPWKWLRANALLTLTLTAYVLMIGFWRL